MATEPSVAFFVPPVPFRPLVGPTARSPLLALVITDVVALALASVVALVVPALLGRASVDDDHVIMAVLGLGVWMAALSGQRLYTTDGRRRDLSAPVGRAALVAVGAMVSIAFFADLEVSRSWIATVAVALPVGLFAGRSVLGRTGLAVQAVRRTVIIGSDPSALALAAQFRREPGLGHEVVGIVAAERVAVIDGVPVLGTVDDVEQILTDAAAEAVVVSPSSVGADRLCPLMRSLDDGGYRVSIATGLCDIDPARIRANDVGGRTLLDVRRVVRTGWPVRAKRVFDVVASLILLVLSAPLILVAMAAIRIESPGSLTFSQWRVGQNGRLFRMHKLRSMVVDAERLQDDLLDRNEADGALFKISHDPRITRVGRLLRSTSVDELPQLVNVLRGEMSLVGPRPALPAEAEQWDDELTARLRVLPGVTGLWQVSGRSETSFAEYKRLDLYYVHNWRLAHDMDIVRRTVREVVARRGAR